MDSHSGWDVCLSIPSLHVLFVGGIWYCLQVVLRESSSDESSDNETTKVKATAAATVSNDKRPRLTANSCDNGQAFDGNFAVYSS